VDLENSRENLASEKGEASDAVGGARLLTQTIGTNIMVENQCGAQNTHYVETVEYDGDAEEQSEYATWADVDSMISERLAAKYATRQETAEYVKAKLLNDAYTTKDYVAEAIKAETSRLGQGLARELEESVSHMLQQTFDGEMQFIKNRCRQCWLIMITLFCEGSKVQ
jgi:ATP-dependent Clp protease adapter protein ClpS